MSVTALSKIIETYLRRTPRSAALAERAAQVFPSGVTHDSRYLEPYEIYVDCASGSRKCDVDGNEYVDYSGGHGALLLGHNHPAVVEAVRRQLERGTHFGASHELEVRWAEAVQRLMPSAERIRFTNSGTEATLLAMRVARAFTGRPKIMRFLGHFHGWHDHAAFGVGSHWEGTPTPGVLPQVARNVVLAPPGDLAATRRALDENPDTAAVIIEPTGASWGQVPVLPEFLRSLRDMTSERGVLLVFDEVISGFRCSPGGAQEALGVRPELTTLAKILAGGLPGGALAGKAEIMDVLDFAASSATGREKVPHQGTYNANPLSAAAGIATLDVVATTDACERASRFAAALRDALNQVLNEENVNWCVYGSYSGFHIFTNPENLDISPAEIMSGQYDYRTLKLPVQPAVIQKLRLAMLLGGVEIFSWPGGPTSAVHTQADLQQTADAFRRALKLLKGDGAIAAVT